MGVGIEKIASGTGYTAGTVRRALRGDSRVKESTSRSILEAAKNLNYHSYLQACDLRSGRAGTIGLVCPSGPSIFVDPYFPPMHSGFTAAAAGEGIRVALYMPPGDGQDWDAATFRISELFDDRVDGSIIYQAQEFSRKALRDLQESGLAVVLVNTDEEIPGFFQILADTRQRIRESLSWAHALGARRVGVLGLSAGTPFNAVARRGLETAGLPVRVDYREVSNTDPYDRGAMDAAADLLMAGRPDAIIFNSDYHLARFLMRMEQGTVPSGPALFSFSGTHNCTPVSFPGVRYVETDLLAAGSRAYLLLKDAMLGGLPRSERLFWSRRSIPPTSDPGRLSVPRKTITLLY